MRIVMALVFLISALAQAAVYKWVDEKGKVHFSDTKPENVDAVEQPVEIKNQNLKMMDDKASKLLEDYDERKRSDEKDLPLQPLKEKADIKVKATNPFGDYEYKCFTPSPSMRGELLVQEEVRPRILVSYEKENIKKLFRQVSGRWKGDIHGYHCLGDEEEPVKESENYKVTVSAKMEISGDLKFKASMSSGSGTGRDERLDFYFKEGTLRLNSANKIGDIEINKITSNNLAFMHKFRVGKRHGRGPMIEVVYNILVKNNELHIKRIAYSSGKLGSVSAWTLR